MCNSIIVIFTQVRLLETTEAQKLGLVNYYVLTFNISISYLDATRQWNRSIQSFRE